MTSAAPVVEDLHPLIARGAEFPIVAHTVSCDSCSLGGLSRRLRAKVNEHLGVSLAPDARPGRVRMSPFCCNVPDDHRALPGGLARG
ncbi:MAG: hypothetical protein ACOY71_07925 [Gemmatimonadota bacterium]